MNALMLIVMLAVNAGISWWSARMTGRSWLEARAFGGHVWPLIWCTVIPVAAGFTLVFGLLLAVVAGAPHLLSRHGVHMAMGLSYLLVIAPIFGSGILITLSSWHITFRERTLSSRGVAAYNSLAMAYDARHCPAPQGSAHRRDLSPAKTAFWAR